MFAIYGGHDVCERVRIVLLGWFYDEREFAFLWVKCALSRALLGKLNYV